MVESYRHLVIGGANKCGTTSLFRYLADHPEICGSSIKEANFFSGPDGGKASYEDYLDIFPGDRRAARWLLEGTPSYLDGGARIASKIKRLLPDAQLVFLLREPIDRLLSFYKSKLGLKTAISYGMTLDQFAEQALRIATGEIQASDRTEKDIGWQVSKADYAPFIKEYLQYFDKDRLTVVFFDEFRSNPKAVAARICRIAGLDSSYLDDYQFAIENRSRFHKSETIRTLGSKINKHLEPLLNRVPAARRLLRNTYNQMNTTDRPALSLSESNLESLKSYYAPRNQALRSLLQTDFGISEFPEWLSAE